MIPERGEIGSLQKEEKEMEKDSRIFVAGADSLIGGAIWRALCRRGYTKVVRGSNRAPDLQNRAKVDDFFAKEKPEYVFFAAGRSAGILGNVKFPADLMHDNLLAECHVVHSAYRHGVKKLLYLASNCCYPKDCPQPMKASHLFTGVLEPTNEFYAVAKIAGIKLCQAYRRQYGLECIIGIPANTFGPGDDFSPEGSHVIGGLLRRMHEAKVKGAPFLEVWGTGDVRREFIFVDDLAEACVLVMRAYDGPEPINMGTGSDLTIKEVAELVKEVVGYPGELRFDTDKPDGMPLKKLDSSLLRAMGWRPRHGLKPSLEGTYRWFLQNVPGVGRG